MLISSLPNKVKIEFEFFPSVAYSTVSIFFPIFAMFYKPNKKNNTFCSMHMGKKDLLYSFHKKWNIMGKYHCHKIIYCEFLALEQGSHIRGTCRINYLTTYEVKKWKDMFFRNIVKPYSSSFNGQKDAIPSNLLPTYSK